MAAVTIIRELQYGDLSRVHRRILAQMNLGLLTEAIHPTDLGLTSLEHVSIVPGVPSAGTVSLTRGSWLQAFLQRPGSFPQDGNHASIQAWGFGLSANGTPILAQLTGSLGAVNIAAEGW